MTIATGSSSVPAMGVAETEFQRRTGFPRQAEQAALPLLLTLVREAQQSTEANGWLFSEHRDKGDELHHDGELLDRIRSVMTVLGIAVADAQEMLQTDIARWLLVLELQLEEAIHQRVPVAARLEQYPRDLQFRAAARRVRLRCVGILDDTLGLVDAVECEQGRHSSALRQILMTVRFKAAPLRLLTETFPGLLPRNSAAPFQVLLQQVVVMVRRELTLADFVEQNEQKQWQAVTLLRRLLQQIRDILQGGAAEESCLQQLLDDCGRYAQRYGAWPQRWQSEEGAAELLRCYEEELSTGLKQLTQEWGELAAASGYRYLCGRHCAWVGRLSSAALLCGDIRRHGLLAALRVYLLWVFEHSEALRHEDLMLFQAVCDAALLNETGAFDALEAQLCDALCARELTAVDADADGRLLFAGREVEGEGQVSIHLAENIRSLLTAATDIESSCQGAEFADLNRRLLVELRMLATGARVLRVYRVEALGRVLADIHQMLDTRQGATLGKADVELLVEAHARLRHALNCAAAYQEVPDSRELIARLYTWLDDDATVGSYAAETHALKVDESAMVTGFQREAVELMERIELRAAALLTTVDQAAVGRAPCQELLSLLHTLKGSALQFECSTIVAACHGFEQMLLQQLTADTARLGACEESSAAWVSVVRACTLSLRAAVDDLGELTARSVPLPAGAEACLPVSAQAMTRIAELSEQSYRCNRAMLEVLAGVDMRQDSAPRLLLLRELLDEQQRHSVQLGEEIAGSRSIRFERLSSRLQRLAHRHANLLNRQVRLQVHGDCIEMDRLLLESLVAPLEHLLRNAIDHGIEEVDERRAASKSDCGSIVVTVTQTSVSGSEEGQRLCIELADDGRGIDPLALTPSGCKEEPQEFRLQRIFDPGFSTRAEVSPQSGHGLGLAAVKEAITALGGSVGVASSLGAGTCFRITLPV